MTHAFDIKRGETSVFSWKNNSSQNWYYPMLLLREYATSATSVVDRGLLDTENSVLILESH